ncbi:hypothetical protein K8R04_03415 [Candidatus Uhrbacteria bacterium]|nr:hypothetical protein [Candidatus Uhrbacteria bacterium]
MYETNVSEALKTLSQLAIGEGEHGIVFRLPGVEDICGKYHKLGYAPHEYDMLVKAYEAGCSVPEPQGEALSQAVFLMDIVYGSTIEQLLQQGKRFSQEIVEECVAITAEFNQRFTHRDLYPRNMMLECWKERDGVIVTGDPVIIDLYLARTGPSKEWYQVRPWFHGRTV